MLTLDGAYLNHTTQTLMLARPDGGFINHKSASQFGFRIACSPTELEAFRQSLIIKEL